MEEAFAAVAAAIATAATQEDSFPPVSQMILAAISKLDGPSGSTKSEIFKFIRTTYCRLPPHIDSQLESELASMKESGEVIKFGNNYIRSEPGAEDKIKAGASKRGRGRPPKAREPLPEGFVPPPPRPRGRPPKAKDPLALAIEKVVSGYPKSQGRGRPGKKVKMDVATEDTEGGDSPSFGGSVKEDTESGDSPSFGGSVKRGRGRPAKGKPEVTEMAA